MGMSRHGTTAAKEHSADGGTRHAGNTVAVAVGTCDETLAMGGRAVCRIRCQLVPGVHHAPARGPVTDRIVTKRLRRHEQRMARGGQSIEIVVAKGLTTSPVRQLRPIANSVVDVIGLIHQLTNDW